VGAKGHVRVYRLVWDEGVEAQGEAILLVEASARLSGLEEQETASTWSSRTW